MTTLSNNDDQAIEIIGEEITLNEPEEEQNPIVTLILKNVQTCLVKTASKLEDEHGFFYVVKIVMECIEVEEIMDIDQRELAENVLLQLIKDSSMDESKKSICITLIKTGAISHTIEMVCDAAKGRIGVNLPKSKNFNILKIFEKIKCCKK